jgi:competence protein ComEA
VALFTRRERIAILLIAVLAIAGWSVRYLREAHRADDAHLYQSAIPIPPELTAPQVDASAPLDINTADAAAIERLPGIGPVKAAAIVDYREAHGPFRSVEALDEVQGIGSATVARLRPLTRVGPAEGPAPAGEAPEPGKKGL